MKVLDYLFVLPFASVLVGALTDQQCSDSCEAGVGGTPKAKSVPACPDADGKKVTSGGVEYQLYCKRAVETTESPLSNAPADDINSCIGQCTRNPKCESVNFFYDSKYCTLLPVRQNPPTYNSEQNKILSAVPTVAASERFQPTDTCMEADGKVKKVGTVDWKITCNKYNNQAPMQPINKYDSMAACAQACQQTSGCAMADYFYQGANAKTCHMRAKWAAAPDLSGPDIASLAPLVDPAIANAPALQSTDQCPAIDKLYKKLGTQTYKMWCGLATAGGRTLRSTTQATREACIDSCLTVPGTQAINYSTGGDNPRLCQCKDTKQDPPTYNLDAKFWWTATLVS